MRLLLASSTLNIKNGYGNATYELVSGMKKLGHEITLLLPSNDTFSQYDIEGVNIKRILPNYLFSYKKINALKYLFWNFKSTDKFDLVHSLFAFPYAPLMAREAKRLGVPFIVGAAGTYGVAPLTVFPERFFLKYAYNSAKAILVPSDYTKNAILNEAKEDYQIKILHFGVNFSRFNNHKLLNSQLKKKYKGKKVLLTVGEVKSRKGQDLVIMALPAVLRKHPDVLYVVVGYPSWQAQFEKLAEELGVKDHVVFTGAVDDDQILDYFHMCDLYVHTPRIYNRFQFEGFGIVYLEAGACGKASVAADAGGIRGAVVDGVTGLIAGNENVEQIAENINILLGDSEMLQQYGLAAKKYAEQHDWPVIAKEFEKIYTKTIN